MNNAHPIANLARLPVNIIQAPTGVFILVGSVPASLGYERIDGAPMTADDQWACANVGPRIAGCRTRSWPTREAAVAAVEAYKACR